MEPRTLAAVTGRGLRLGLKSGLAAASIAALLTTALAVYATVQRHRLAGPSLVDDWTMLRWSPKAFHQIAGLHYDSRSFDALRYRPAFYGIWSYLEWHTLGAPRDMTGPNLWNLLRIGAFGLALSLLVFAGLRPEVRRGLSPLSIGLLAAIPGALVFTTPSFGLDFARLGPQEPLLVAGMGLGGLALLLAARLVLERGARAFAIAMLVVVGLALWSFGVYVKEPAVCVVLFAPFLVLELRRRWHPVRPTRLRILVVIGIGVLALAPVLHLAVELHGLSGRSALIYGATAPHGIGGWISRLRVALYQQWVGVPYSLGQPIWRGLATGLPPLSLAVWLRSSRPPWIPLGLIVLAASILVFQGIPGVVTARYYIPVFALMSISLALLLAELPAGLRAAALVAIAVLGLNGLSGAHKAVQAWLASEQADQATVQAAARLNPRRCPVYYAGFDIERHDALPVVVALHRDDGRPCAQGEATLLVEGLRSGLRGDPLAATCASPGWTRRAAAGRATIFSCQRVRPRPLAGYRLPVPK